MSEDKNTVEKKVYVYEITSDKGVIETFDLIKNKVNGDMSKLEERNLIYTDKKTGLKYFLDIKAKNKYKKVNSKDDLIIYECILYKLRADEFPYLFDILTGKTTEINTGLTDTLMEQTHFIVIPEINLLISEYNHFGAQPQKLIFIVDKILGPLYSTGFEVKHILNTTTAYRIKNLQNVETISIKCGHQGLKTINHYFNVNFLDVMDKGFRNTSDLEFKFEIRGKGRSTNKKFISFYDNEKFKRFCNLIFHSKNKKTLDIHCAKIRERGGNLEVKELPIDLFSDYFVEEVKAIRLKDKCKYIDSTDMFNKLLELYNENKFEISNFIKIEF